MATKATPLCFPQELVDLVIDCLYDDFPSLRACALTGHAWLNRSRSHLHRVLKLSSRSQCRKALSAYETNPTLTRCIREVELSDRRLRLGPEQDSDHWLSKDLPDVIRKLQGSSLDSVLLQDVRGVSWGAQHSCLFPTVTKLVLNRAEFNSGLELAAVLSHFPALTKLIAEHLVIVDRRANPTIPGIRPRLHTLIINGGTGQEFLMNWFLHQPADRFCLENLAYTVERWRLFAPCASLEAIGSSVQNLTVIFAFDAPHYLLKGDPLLPFLRSIRALSFDFSTFYSTIYGPSSIPVLLNIVSSMATTAIRFRFNLDSGHIGYDDGLAKVMRIRLAETDRKLGSSENFANLSEVRVELRWAPWIKLDRLPTESEWVQIELDHVVLPEKLKASPKTPAALEDPAEPVVLDGDESDGEPSKKSQVERIRTLQQRAQADYQKAKDTWRLAKEAVHRALPQISRQSVLRIDALDGKSPTRSHLRGRSASAGPWEYVF